MEEKYTCHKCGYESRSYAGLKTHRAKKHPLDFVKGMPFAMREVRMTRIEEWILDNLAGEEE